MKTVIGMFHLDIGLWLIEDSKKTTDYILDIYNMYIRMYIIYVYLCMHIYTYVYKIVLQNLNQIVIGSSNLKFFTLDPLCPRSSGALEV